MRCDICDNDEALPFKCRYCHGTFCGAHRLPPNHSCPFVDDYIKQPAREREYIERLQGKRGAPQERMVALLKNTVVLRFSRTEVLHLLIGTALVTAVGMSFYGFRLRWDFLAIFISAFMLHELGHKFLAQAYRAWAEFRVLLYGAAITALSAIPFFPFKFIAPGAVFVSGELSARRQGKVSWIGPIINLVMGTGFLVSYLAINMSAYSAGIGAGLGLGLGGFAPQILLIGARFNAWIALFNLIPFMGLDGQQVFSWNKVVWAVTMAAAIGLFVGTDLASGGGILGSFRRRF
jgi:Zn-dependent protease